MTFDKSKHMMANKILLKKSVICFLFTYLSLESVPVIFEVSTISSHVATKLSTKLFCASTIF